MFLLVPAYPGCPGSKAVKRSLLLLLSRIRQTNFYFVYIFLFQFFLLPNFLKLFIISVFPLWRLQHKVNKQLHMAASFSLRQLYDSLQHKLQLSTKVLSTLKYSRNKAKPFKKSKYMYRYISYNKNYQNTCSATHITRSDMSRYVSIRVKLLVSDWRLTPRMAN